jgi:hypothetical protein
VPGHSTYRGVTKESSPPIQNASTRASDVYHSPTREQAEERATQADPARQQADAARQQVENENQQLRQQLEELQRRLGGNS